MSLRGSKEGLRPKTDAGRLALSLAQENGHLTIGELLPLVKAQYPKYTDSALRILLHRYGVTVTTRVYANPEAVKKYKGKPKAEAKPMPEIQHVAVQAYHGRSRLLPGYYEL